MPSFPARRISMIDRELWSLAAMAQAMGAKRSGPLPSGVSGISIDSRTLVPGEAFFAISGTHREGHDFVAAALQAGAAVAVVSASKCSIIPNSAPLLIVSDVLAGLTELARAARTRSLAKVIGVTGSVGKTSTKEALRIALAAEGETHASASSFNNHWGVPLSLARLPASARYGVFEIGMNHAGEITPLAHLVRPHVAIVTAIEPVHLEFFDSLADIADAKAEIFCGVEADGAAIINRDTAHFERLQRHAADAGIKQVITFGEHPDAHARLLECTLHPEYSAVEADILGVRVTYQIGAPGRHLVLNSLAVLAAAEKVGVDLASAARALVQCKPPPGRGTRITLHMPDGPALLIDESYNANPSSMRAALALLGQAPVGPYGRRIAVLGDMLELGPAGADLHRSLADAVCQNGVDLVFCAGPLMQALWHALPSERRGGYAETASGLEPDVVDTIRSGDAVMIKGSLGSKMTPIVKALIRARGQETHV
jgi:UDP-N-acetylmuramoyl-tripeptide--D-alanyl-D-alanine ligase